MVMDLQHTLEEAQHDPLLSNQDKSDSIRKGEDGSPSMLQLLSTCCDENYIPECYVPPKRIIKLRELVRYRADLVRMKKQREESYIAYLPMNMLGLELF